MEALIAKAVPALREVLIEQEFAHCSKVEKNLEEFEQSNNHVLMFFEELTEVDYLNEPVKTVYQRYSTFCLSNNLQAMSAMEFQRQMRKEFSLVVKTVEINGRRCRVYNESE